MLRTLVVAPNWIGDALMAQPLLGRLRAEGEVDVLAPDWVAPVLQRMPEVAEVIAAPLQHGRLQLGERLRVARALRGRYARAFVLPNSWKSALVPFLAGIPERIGYRGELRYLLLNRILRSTDEPMREHYARLAGPIGTLPQPRLRSDAQAIDAALRKFSLARPYVVLCPGAEYGPAKRWPYFASLAEQIGVPVVLLGSAKDLESCRGIRGLNLAGRTTLDEAIDLIAGAQAVVSNDSGLMHVAAALARPQVALFGSSSPEHTPPQSAAARVLWLKVECSPCYARECPLGHFRCMKELSVDTVLKEIRAIV